MKVEGAEVQGPDLGGTHQTVFRAKQNGSSLKKDLLASLYTVPTRTCRSAEAVTTKDSLAQSPVIASAELMALQVSCSQRRSYNVWTPAAGNSLFSPLSETKERNWFELAMSARPA